MSAGKLRIRFSILFLVIAGSFIARFLPLPPNFSPIFAAAMFGGTYFYNKKFAYIVPLTVMILSDAIQYKVMGYDYPQMISIVVYACIALIVFLGSLMRNKATASRVITGSLSSSVGFFMITNFFVWVGGSIYPMTAEGLLACYVAAVPYFHNTLLSGLLFSGVLYGGYYLLATKYALFQVPVKA